MNDRAFSVSRLSFWHLQIAGWAAYFVMIVVTFLPMLPPGASVWPLVRVKVIRTGLGFTITCLLRLVTAALPRGASVSPRSSRYRPPWSWESGGDSSPASSGHGTISDV